jgi:hypothetical protein
VLFYGVVSAQTEKVVEFFLEREAAEAMIGEVRVDEPVLAEDLRCRGDRPRLRTTLKVECIDADKKGR